jgi:superfamily II DNA or RNA helicase
MKHDIGLRSYQTECSLWLQEVEKGICALDVGLGKSPVALDAAQTPTLIVCPAYLVAQWRLFMETHTQGLQIITPTGLTPTQRKRQLASSHHVAIVNKEMLRGDDIAPQYTTVILDEAHHFRKPKPAQSEGVRFLARSARRAYFLTASPHYKRVDDIWHLLHIIDKQRYPSYWDFLKRWCAVNWNAPYTPTIYGIKTKLKEAWEEEISHYMYMRTYKDVGRVLPPLIEKHATFPLPKLLRGAYDTAKKKWQLLSHPLESSGEQIVALRSITMCDAKIRTLLDVLEDIPPTEPVCIYTWYRESASLVYASVLATKRKCLLITGDITPELRGKAIDNARANGVHYIIATQSSLNEGANLQWIRYVVFVEEDYVAEAHRQCLARFRRDRDGASNEPVIAYYIRAQRTIDETIPSARIAGARNMRDIARSLFDG